MNITVPLISDADEFEVVEGLETLYADSTGVEPSLIQMLKLSGAAAKASFRGTKDLDKHAGYRACSVDIIRQRLEATYT